MGLTGEVNQGCDSAMSCAQGSGSSVGVPRWVDVTKKRQRRLAEWSSEINKTRVNVISFSGKSQTLSVYVTTPCRKRLVIFQHNSLINPS